MGGASQLASLTPQGAAAGAATDIVSGLASGGPSSADVGDVSFQTGFGPVTIASQFAQPATNPISGIPPYVWLGVAGLVAAVFVFRKR